MNIELINQKIEKVESDTNVTDIAVVISAINEYVSKIKIVAPLSEEKKIELMELAQKLTDVKKRVFNKWEPLKKSLFETYNTIQKPLLETDKIIKKLRQEIDTKVMNYNRVMREEAEKAERERLKKIEEEEKKRLEEIEKKRKEAEESGETIDIPEPPVFAPPPPSVYHTFSKGVKSESGSYSVNMKNKVDEIDILKILTSYHPNFIKEHFNVTIKASFIKFYEDAFGKNVDNWKVHDMMINKNEGATPGVKILQIGSSNARGKR